MKTPDFSLEKRHVKIQLDQQLPHLPDVRDRSSKLLSKTSTSQYSDDDSSQILRGQKSQLAVYEPIEELNDEIRAARQYVQHLKHESHSKQRKREAEIKENQTVNRQPIRHQTLDDRLLRTIHGSMAFGCLVAVDKAYSDRAKLERKKFLAQDIENKRQEHSYNLAQNQVNRRNFSRLLIFNILFSTRTMNVLHRFIARKIKIE